MRIRTVDDQVLARCDRHFETLGVQAPDIAVQPIAIGVSDRGQFLHADLDHPREIFDLLLRGRDDRLLSAKADPDLGAKSQAEQPDHQHD